MLYLLLVYTIPVSEFLYVVPNSDVFKSVTSLGRSLLDWNGCAQQQQPICPSLQGREIEIGLFSVWCNASPGALSISDGGREQGMAFNGLQRPSMAFHSPFLFVRATRE